MTLSEKLVILRKKAGMTQGDLAAALEVSRQSVHKWESGQCYPEVPKLIGMKAIFAISIDDLLDDAVEIAMPEKKKTRKASTEEKAAPVNEQPVAEETKAPEVKPVFTSMLNFGAEEKKAEEAPAVEEIEVEVIENTKPEVKEEPVVEAAPVKAEPEKVEPVIEAPEKKKGFFSKLFGRK